MRALTSLIATALMGLPAQAEGRNDPLMECVFPEGRSIVVAEAGEDLVWHEGPVSLPAKITAQSGEGRERTVVITARSSSPRILYLTGFEGNEAKGALTGFETTAEGLTQMISVFGTCEEFVG